jgi:superfamily I DNA and RNA helicase
MFQPLIEKTLVLELGMKVEIDNMSFYLKKIQVEWETDDFSISIWGSAPNATTFHHSRIIKYGQYVWRPEKNGLSFSTIEDQNFDSITFEEESLKKFIGDQNKKDDEIINCSVKMTTAINEPRGYDFSKN